MVMVKGCIGLAPAVGLRRNVVLRARLVGTDHFDAYGQIFGTRIHHADGATKAVCAIAIAMIEPAILTPLMGSPCPTNDFATS
jgi:hypothetical protein